MALQYTPKIYSGTDYEGVFSEILHQNNTMKNKLVTFIDGVKHTINLTEREGGAIIQDYSVTKTDANAQGNVKLSDVALTPIKKELYDRFTYEDVRASRFSKDMSIGAASTESNDFLQGVLAQIEGKASEDIEAMYWGMVMGSVSGSTSVQKVTGTTMTEANLVTEFKKVYAKIDTRILASSELRIFADHSVKPLIMIANLNATYRDSFVVQGENCYFLGVKIEFVPLGANKMIAGIKSDFVLGTDSTADFGNLEVGRVYNDGDLFFIRGVFTLGAAVKVQKQKVLYI